MASLNEQQGILEVPLEEGVSKSTPIVVSFNYDRSRTLTIGVRIQGKPTIQQVLRHDRGRIKPAQRDDQSLAEDWREDLQPSLRAAEHFLESYGDYMDADDKEELTLAIKDASTALETNNEEAGRTACNLLQNKVIASGTASKLFIAERMISGATPAVARELADSVAALRDAHRSGNQSLVNRLGAVLSSRVAQVMTERAQTGRVEDRQNLNDLLLVRD